MIEVKSSAIGPNGEQTWLKLESIHETESWGGYGHSKMLIAAMVPGGVTKELREKLFKHCYAIERAIQAHMLNTDPENMERGQVWKDTLPTLFKLAGFDPIYVEWVPDQYSPDREYLPWAIVTTQFGRIKIGWRKRVISIDWTESKIRARGDELFKDEGVTTDPHLVHAYGYEKAAEYLKKLRENA